MNFGIQKIYDRISTRVWNWYVTLCAKSVWSWTNLTALSVMSALLLQAVITGSSESLTSSNTPACWSLWTDAERQVKMFELKIWKQMLVHSSLITTTGLQVSTDLTRSPKQGYKWPHEKDLDPPIFFKKKSFKFNPNQDDPIYIQYQVQATPTWQISRSEEFHFGGSSHMWVAPTLELYVRGSTPPLRECYMWGHYHALEPHVSCMWGAPLHHWGNATHDGITMCVSHMWATHELYVMGSPLPLREC